MREDEYYKLGEIDGNLASALYYNGVTLPAAVVDIVATIDGENDVADWHWLAVLADGQCAYITGGCDYTGWDCRSNCEAFVEPDMKACVRQIIERWERGDLVPTNQEWQRLRAVFPALDRGNRYRELFEAAAAEQFELEQARKDVAPVPAEEKQGDLDAAVNMLLDAVAGLRSLRIEVDDDGHAAVTYVTREVRVVEDSGTMQVRRR